MQRSEWPTVTELYADRDIFITGVSGFLGKCLLEKVLRSLNTAGRVFVLLRPKSGKSAQERIKDVTNAKLFTNLHIKSPEAFDRVVPVAGDISKPGIGISKEDEKILVENVSIVFHLAATVRFDAPLRDALQYNVVAVKGIINLCHKMKKLKALVHVSTAYSNCPIKNIDEIIYPSNVDYEKVLDLLNWMTDEQLELLTPSLLQDYPNTYTWTKSLAENLLQNEAKDLPVAIVRPSIVGAAYKEPLPGWIDTVQGATGVLIAIGKGILRVLCFSSLGTLNLVPVDYVNNFMITVGWITALKRTSEIVVYNYNSTQNPINYLRSCKLIAKSYNENPFDQIYRRPHIYFIDSVLIWPYLHFVMHCIPGYFVDILLKLSGHKPIMIKTYQKLYTAINLLYYFAVQKLVWSHNNYDTLLSLLSKEDKQMFNFDVTSFDWDKYISIGCMGIKKYVFKDDLSNLPRARQNIKRRRNIRRTFDFIIFLLAVYLLYRYSHIAREIWSRILGVCLKFFNEQKQRVQ